MLRETPRLGTVDDPRQTRASCVCSRCTMRGAGWARVPPQNRQDLGPVACAAGSGFEQEGRSMAEGTRLDELERRLYQSERRSRAFCACGFVSLTAALLLLAMKPGSTKDEGSIVRAPFKVISREGRVLFRVTAVGNGTGLEVLDGAGKTAVHISTRGEGGALVTHGRDGHATASLGTNPLLMRAALRCSAPKGLGWRCIPEGMTRHSRCSGTRSREPFSPEPLRVAPSAFTTSVGKRSSSRGFSRSSTETPRGGGSVVTQQSRDDGPEAASAPPGEPQQWA